jgi:Zn-finger nucleic acid-binding protein
MTATESLHCLSCGSTLDQRREHGVTIDYCPECGGVWLDPGELERLTGHSSHSHSHSHGHDRDVDVDIGEEEEFEAEEEEEDGILGAIAGALGGEEEEGEFEEGGEFEEEEEFEMEGGFEEEDEF